MGTLAQPVRGCENRCEDSTGEDWRKNQGEAVSIGGHGRQRAQPEPSQSPAIISARLPGNVSAAASSCPAGANVSGERSPHACMHFSCLGSVSGSVCVFSCFWTRRENLSGRRRWFQSRWREMS